MFHQKVSPTSDNLPESSSLEPIALHNHYDLQQQNNASGGHKVDYSLPPTLPPPPPTPPQNRTNPAPQPQPTSPSQENGSTHHQPMTSTADKNLQDLKKNPEQADFKNSNTSLDSPPASQPLLSDHSDNPQPTPTVTTTPPPYSNTTSGSDSLLSPYHPPPVAPPSNTVFRKRVSPASNGFPDQQAYDSMAMEPLTTSSGGLGDDHPNNMQLAVKKDAEQPPEDIKENIDPDEESPKWDLLVYYAQNSTMHGIPSIVGSELYPGRHFFWIGVVCIMGVFLGTVIYWQMSDYYDYPTVTSVNIAYVNEDDFPAITMCDLNMFHAAFIDSMQDNYTAYHLTKLTEITGFYHKFSKKILRVIPEPAPGANSSVWHIQEMMKLMYKMMSHPDFNRLYCSWGDYYWEPCPSHKPRVTEIGMCDTIDVRGLAKKGKLPTSIRECYYWEPCPSHKPRVTEIGMCDTIDVRGLAKKGKLPTSIRRGKPKESTTTPRPDGEDNPKVKDAHMKGQKPQPAVGNAMRGLTFYLDTESAQIPYRIYQYDGFKIMLHNPDEEPLPRQNGFLVQGNTTVEVEISKQVKKGLPPPYKAFGSGTCVDTKSSSFPNPLKRFDKYTKEVCENECFINAVIETCGGCRHFLHPGNESICEIEHLAECFREAEAMYYGGNRTDQQCSCPMPCEDARYSAAVTSTPFKSTDMFLGIQDKYNIRFTSSLTYIHFYYADPVVTTIEQVPIYSTEGLLGNIGGQIGLFMGFSLITVAETLELIFLLATRGRRLDEQVKRQKSIRIAATSA